MRFRRGGRKDESRATTVEANLRDTSVEGPLAIGEHIVQYSAGGDIVVQQLPPHLRPVLKLRELPVRRLPRDFSALLGRTAQVREVLGTLASGATIEFAGMSGIGKTVMLRYLAHRVTGPATRDGVLHTHCGEQRPRDLLQWLFESFVESDGNTKATPAQLDTFLRERAATVLLDDVAISRDGIGEFTNGAPGCTFVWAAHRRLLWGEGASVELSALPEDSALELFKREARDVVGEGDAPAALAVCRSLHGHPLRVLQAAALVRAVGGPSLDELAATPGPDAFDALRERSLTAAELRILGPLAALPGASLGREDLAAIIDAPDAGIALASLEGRNIVQSHSPRYSVAGEPGPVLSEPARASQWRDRALEHFASRTPPVGEAVADLPAVLSLLQHGAATGRWDRVLAVVRGEERRLALDGRWDAWAEVLEYGRRAASESGDRVAVAWVDHQLGTRALCLGELNSAASLLAGALQLRRELPGEEIAGTEHNLRRALELGATPPAGTSLGGEAGGSFLRRRTSRRPRGSEGAPGRVPWPVTAATALGLGLAAGVVAGNALEQGNGDVASPRTITGSNQIVTVIRTVSEPGKDRTVTDPGTTRTVTTPGKDRTVTQTETVTNTETETVTDTETETVTDTETETVTNTVTDVRTETVTVRVTPQPVP